jgi:O-antigen ligase
MGYVVALLWAAASAVLFRWRAAGFLGIFLLATAFVLHGGWLGFGVLAAAGGTAVMVGGLAGGARSAAASRLARSPVSVGLALVLAGVWLSFVANRASSTPAEVAVMLRDAKGLTLALVVYAAGFGLATGFRRVRVAIWALLAIAAAVGALRVGQMVGLDATSLLSAPFGASFMGDVGPYAQQNSYGTFQTLVLTLALYVLVRPPRWRGALIAAGALTVVLQWLLLNSHSRTAILAYAIVLGVALLLARGRQRRVVLVTAVAFVVLGIANTRIQFEKPVLAAPQFVSPSDMRAELPKAAATEVTEQELTFWTSALTTPRLKAVQRIRVPDPLPPGDDALHLFIRHPTWDAPGAIEVEVDGHLVQELPPRAPDDWVGEFFWVTVPVSRSLLEGRRSILVTVGVRGQADARLNYVEVAGGSFRARGIRSELFNGYGFIAEDLSQSRGPQIGTFMIFLNEYWPERVERTRRPPRLALDNSIVERGVWARVALANYAAHPLVGSGFGTLVFQAPRYIGGSPVFVDFVNAHSNFLQILSECGILGLAGWLIMTLGPVGLILTRRWSRRSGPLWSSFDLAFGGFCVVWALGSLAQYTVTDTRLFHLWLFYLGIWAAQFHRGGYGLLRWPSARSLARSPAPPVMEGSAASAATRWRAS